MTANASPAVLAPVDVETLLANVRYAAVNARLGLPVSPNVLSLVAAAVEQMAAELAAARADIETYQANLTAESNARMAAEADAARYRWLRDVSPYAKEHTPTVYNRRVPRFDVDAPRRILDGADLDAAIDAALQEPRP